MIKLRSAMIEDSTSAMPEAYFYPLLNTNGLKTIRELATFRFTCRKCEDAPCINVCPADALEKDENGSYFHVIQTFVFHANRVLQYVRSVQ